MWRALLLLAAVHGCGRVGFEPICELGVACVQRVEINEASAFARGPRLTVVVTTSSASEVRIAESRGSCESAYADDGWQPVQGEATTVDVLVEPSDGIKKVCAWARAGAQAVRDRERPGIDFDTITYEAASPPVVVDLDVIPLDDGARMRVTWTVVDVEGLADHPVELTYTTEPSRTAWRPLVAHAGDGGGTRSTGSIDLDAPTTAPFIVRLVPTDRAGNRGIAATSDVVNGGAWGVYLGSSDRGIGGAATTAQLQFETNAAMSFAIDPRTLDVYATDHGHGVIRVDAATGRVERLIAEGDLNLPDDGPLPPDAAIPLYGALEIGPDGRLYIFADIPDGGVTSSVIYQLDLETRHCRRYVGGGNLADASATPSTVYVSSPAYTFDEASTMYFLASCAPGTSNPPLRMMKVTQQPDGTAGVVSIVAGNCASGIPPPGGPHDPAAVPLGSNEAIGSIAAWDRGRVIYFASYPGVTWKILDGQLYETSLVVGASGSLSYDSQADELYVANNHIERYRPELTGAGGETQTGVLVAADGTGSCTLDGVPAARACVRAQWTIRRARDLVFFFDGAGLNETRTYRVRFVGRDGHVRTYLGAPQFHGEGADRQVARGQFAGIAYKPPTAPNQASFPAGLYFLDPKALVFGHVDELERVVIDWGDQSGKALEAVTGAEIGAGVGLGDAYSGGNLHPLAFDRNGLPWLRYGPSDSDAALVHVDAARRVVRVQGGPLRWETAPDGSDPADLELWPYGAINNLTVDGDRVYLLGGYSNSSPTRTIKLLDFGTSVVTQLMGAPGNTYTPDRLTPGTASTASLSSLCSNNNDYCFTQYDAGSDRLYFTEGSRLRYLTTPAAPSTSTLETLWTEPNGDRVRNFIFHPGGAQVFHLTGDGQLRCHDLGSGATWCDDADLGPLPLLGSIEHGANQLAWQDDRTLLISTYRGTVLRYRLP